MVLKAPLKLPTGVLVAETITISSIFYSPPRCASRLAICYRPRHKCVRHRRKARRGRKARWALHAKLGCHVLDVGRDDVPVLIGLVVTLLLRAVLEGAGGIRRQEADTTRGGKGA